MTNNFKNPIFITARFRSGSTLLWNIYNNASGAHAYYEPLHEQLPELISRNISPQARHYFVDTYFRQYPDVETLKRFHSTEFGVSQLFLEKQDEHPDLQNYINFLISHSTKKNVAVLQFNRIDFRLPWVRKNFPKAALIHLYRSPRDQWISTIQGYPIDVDKNIDSDPYRITTWSRDLIKQFPFLSTPYIRHSYQRYYYLWKLSYLMGRQLCDYSIAYEDILSKPGKSIRLLLELGQLDTHKNIEKCLGIIIKRPVNVWKKYHSENWFAEMEQECETQLSALGLNQNFGGKTLNQIIAANSKYQKMMADARPVTWVIKNSQLSIVNLLNEADEKEKVIQDQHQGTSKQRETINEQIAVIQTKNRALEKQGKEIIRLNNVIVQQQRDLSNKEQVINSFRYLPIFWLQNGPLRNIPVVKDVVSRVRVFRRFFLSKLGVLAQHPPKPLEIPDRYHQTQGPIREAPVISIVTPSYNQADFIGKTIQSVLGQRYPNLEYVVQDGKSKDDTLNILKKYKNQLTHFESRLDNGQSHAINLGFRHTQGEIMAYLNSDDILLPGALNYVANYFLKHPEIDAIYSHRVIIDEKDREIGRWLMPRHDDQVLYWADYVPQETLFWRRNIWEKAGGKIDETFRFALDWDLLMRFLQSDAVIRRVPRFLAAFRVHHAQKTSVHINKIGMQEMQRIRKQYLGHTATSEDVFKHIKPYLNRSIIYHKLFRLGIYRA